MARYRDQGEEGLKSRYGSHTGPRLAEPVRDKILELKKEEPTRGIKKVSQLLKRVFFLQAMSVEVELVTHQLNHRRLRSLDQRTPCQVYRDPARRLRLHGASRQRIFREVFEQFWQYVQCMPERNRHTTNAAWRLVVDLAPPPGMDHRNGKTKTESVNRFQTIFLPELVLHYRRRSHRDWH